MPGFQNFKQSTQAETPRYFEAAVADSEADAAKEQQRLLDTVSAIQLYNQGMGDSTPIADYLRTKFGTTAGTAGTSTTTGTTGTSMVGAGGGAGGAGGGGGVITGGAGTAGTGAATAGTGASTATAGTGTAGASAAGGGKSMVAAGGPWALLAAAIIANETDAKKGGHRRSGSKYWEDLALGKSLSQDLEERIPDALGFQWSDNDTGNMAKHMMQGAMNPLDLQAQAKGAKLLAKETGAGAKKMFNKYGKKAVDPLGIAKLSKKADKMFDPLGISSALRKLV